jgi:hypothetical protein
MRSTHSLDSAEGGRSQDMERKRASAGHSLSGEYKARQVRTRNERASRRRALTCWRVQMEGEMRTQKENERVRSTYILQNTKGGTSEDTKRE